MRTERSGQERKAAELRHTFTIQVTDATEKNRTEEETTNDIQEENASVLKGMDFQLERAQNSIVSKNAHVRMHYPEIFRTQKLPRMGES